MEIITAVIRAYRKQKNGRKKIQKLINEAYQKAKKAGRKPHQPPSEPIRNSTTWNSGCLNCNNLERIFRFFDGQIFTFQQISYIMSDDNI